MVHAYYSSHIKGGRRRTGCSLPSREKLRRPSSKNKIKFRCQSFTPIILVTWEAEMVKGYARG
jgi:hypothetical protein